MTRKQIALGSVGFIALAAASLAASRVDPVEAKTPPASTIPAAESVEVVLRASYALPAHRAEHLATFLEANAVPGIDVRFENDRLTVIAPAVAQKALGSFIELCVRKDSAEIKPTGPVPDPVIPGYRLPFDGGLPPSSVYQRPASRPATQPGQAPARSELPSSEVPNFGEPFDDDSLPPPFSVPTKAPARS